MSIFRDIVNKIFHKGQEVKAQGAAPSGSPTSQPGGGAQPSQGTPPPPSGGPAPTPSVTGQPGQAGQPGSPPPAGANALSDVDVAVVMDRLVIESGQTLNWRTSIVDSMKALGIDSSLEHRKALAKELHYTGDENDSATMNVWLHKKLMSELAANGGKLPKDLTA